MTLVFSAEGLHGTSIFRFGKEPLFSTVKIRTQEIPKRDCPKTERTFFFTRTYDGKTET